MSLFFCVKTIKQYWKLEYTVSTRSQWNRNSSAVGRITVVLSIVVLSRMNIINAHMPATHDT